MQSKQKLVDTSPAAAAAVVEAWGAASRRRRGRRVASHQAPALSFSTASRLATYLLAQARDTHW